MKKYILVFIFSVVLLAGCQKADVNEGDSIDDKESMSKEDIDKSLNELNKTADKIEKNSTLINIDTDPLSDL